jgi:hypothetical protein
MLFEILAYNTLGYQLTKDQFINMYIVHCTILYIVQSVLRIRIRTAFDQLDTDTHSMRIQTRIDLKYQIRIRNETNADPKHFLPVPFINSYKKNMVLTVPHRHYGNSAGSGLSKWKNEQTTKMNKTSEDVVRVGYFEKMLACKEGR